MATIKSLYAVNSLFSTTASAATKMTTEEFEKNPNQEKRLITILNLPKEINVRNLVYKERITVVAFIINILISPIVAILAALGWVFARSSQFTAQQIERLVQLCQGSWITYDQIALDLLQATQISWEGSKVVPTADHALYYANGKSLLDAAIRMGADPNTKCRMRVDKEERDCSRLEVALLKGEGEIAATLLSREEKKLDSAQYLALLERCRGLPIASQDLIELVEKKWLMAKGASTEEAGQVASLVAKAKFKPKGTLDPYTQALHFEATTKAQCDLLIKHTAIENLYDPEDGQLGPYSYCQNAMKRGEIAIVKACLKPYESIAFFNTAERERFSTDVLLVLSSSKNRKEMLEVLFSKLTPPITYSEVKQDVRELLQQNAWLHEAAKQGDADVITFLIESLDEKGSQFSILSNANEVDPHGYVAHVYGIESAKADVLMALRTLKEGSKAEITVQIPYLDATHALAKVWKAHEDDKEKKAEIGRIVLLVKGCLVERAGDLVSTPLPPVSLLMAVLLIQGVQSEIKDFDGFVESVVMAFLKGLSEDEQEAERLQMTRTVQEMLNAETITAAEFEKLVSALERSTIFDLLISHKEANFEDFLKACIQTLMTPDNQARYMARLRKSGIID